jgi:hypothetical protein
MLIKVLIFVFLFLILFQLLEQGPMLVENFAKRIKSKSKSKPKPKPKVTKQDNKKMLQPLVDDKGKMTDMLMREVSKVEMNINKNYVSKNEFKDEFNNFKDQIQTQIDRSINELVKDNEDI